MTSIMADRHRLRALPLGKPVPSKSAAEAAPHTPTCCLERFSPGCDASGASRRGRCRGVPTMAHAAFAIFNRRSSGLPPRTRCPSAPFLFKQDGTA